MFHSLHEVGALHAAARAVGGCPVYVSDAQGQHDVQLLRRLAIGLPRNCHVTAT